MYKIIQHSLFRSAGLTVSYDSLESALSVKSEAAGVGILLHYCKVKSSEDIIDYSGSLGKSGSSASPKQQEHGDWPVTSLA